MTFKVKLLFTSIAFVLIVVGVLAVIRQVHTGYARFVGIRTFVGDDAVWLGETFLIMAVLPLLVWLPKRWVGVALFAWWLALMAWIFIGLFYFCFAVAMGRDLGNSFEINWQHLAD